MRRPASQRELSDGARHAITAHLDGCVDCLEAFDFHAELKVMVSRKCQSDEIPPGLMAKIEQCFGLAVGDDADQPTDT